jgi:folate-binding protein YgfZ
MQEYLKTRLDLNHLEHKTIERAGQNWVVVHRDRSGCDGYDLWLPRDEVEHVWSDWAEKLQPVGHESLNRLRTEAGIPWFGVDMGNHHLPLEFGLTKAVSLNKGCYRGQEIMARITYRGHMKKGFGGIQAGQPRMPAHGTAVLANGEKVGEITSAAFSPRLQAPLALALLKTDFLEAGTAVELSFGDERIPGVVVTLPLS